MIMAERMKHTNKLKATLSETYCFQISWRCHFLTDTNYLSHSLRISLQFSNNEHDHSFTEFKMGHSSFLKEA